MRRVSVFLIAFALALGAAVVLGQDCKQLNVTFKPESIDLDPADYQYLIEIFGLEIDGFDWCWSQEVVGTIRGTWVSCGAMDLAQFAPLFGPIPKVDGPGPDLYGNPGVIHTRKGDVYTMSYGLSVYDGETWVSFGGVTWYGDGTAYYAGATGWATDEPKQYPPSLWIRSIGFLCRPESAVLEYEFDEERF